MLKTEMQLKNLLVVKNGPFFFLSTNVPYINQNRVQEKEERKMKGKTKN